MQTAYEKLKKCQKSLRRQTDFQPETAIVLGSGLGDFVNRLRVDQVIDYEDVEAFPRPTVPGHEGKFFFGWLGPVPVVCMQGRVHYYEGYDIEDVVLPVRLLRLLGADTLFLTNAAGGIGDGFEAGDLMLITDQISSFVPSPLRGENIAGLGIRFPDMSQIYNKELQDIIREAARDLQIPLREGIYVQLPGPQYETPAEVRMCKLLGASAVGMSTAAEAVAAIHAGMKLAGLSCITNPAAGLGGGRLSHEEVQKRADEAGPRFQSLLEASVRAAFEKKLRE